MKESLCPCFKAKPLGLSTSQRAETFHETMFDVRNDARIEALLFFFSQIYAYENLSRIITIPGCPEDYLVCIRYLERVQLVLTVSAQQRGSISVSFLVNYPFVARSAIRNL